MRKNNQSRKGDGAGQFEAVGKSETDPLAGASLPKSSLRVVALLENIRDAVNAKNFTCRVTTKQECHQFANGTFGYSDGMNYIGSVDGKELVVERGCFTGMFKRGGATVEGVAVSLGSLCVECVTYTGGYQGDEGGIIEIGASLKAGHPCARLKGEDSCYVDP